MAWRSPNCIVRAVQSVRKNALLQPSLQFPVVSASPLPLPTSTHFLQRQRQNPFSTSSRQCAADATEVQAAPEIDFSKLAIAPARIVPASPSYFSGSPKFFDHLLNLERILAKYASLPTVPTSEAPRMAWLKLTQFRDFVGEPVPTKKYKNLLKILQRLNRIDPNLAPREVRETLHTFLRPGNPYESKPEPPVVDELGRARGTGKRKESSAVACLVEGEGEVLVNGKTLVEAFPRLHDRESAMWPLRCTQRLDKYNVWVTVKGGGVTGQAEAITLALARALLVHEPGLKPVLRKGTRQDPARDCSEVYLEMTFVLTLIFSQRALLLSMHGAWKGRSQVMSRRARCQPGSNGEEKEKRMSFLPLLYYFLSRRFWTSLYMLYLSSYVQYVMGLASGTKGVFDVFLDCN